MVTSTKASRHTPKKPAAASSFAKKPNKAKPNASILSFFKKTEKQEDSLFIGAAPEVSIALDEDLYEAQDLDRYNEDATPNKKRKLSQEAVALVEDDSHVQAKEEPVPSVKDEKTIDKASPDGAHPQKPIRKKIKTPFVIDSDSEGDDDDVHDEKSGPSEPKPEESADPPLNVEDRQEEFTKDNKRHSIDEPPHFKQEDSTYAQFEDLGEFAEFGDLDMDDLEGEEARVMRFMREQARLEAEAEGFSSEDLADEPMDDDTMIESCPVCNGSLAAVSADDATRHVNSCLDGNPIPLPKQEKSISKPKHTQKEETARVETPEVESEEVSKRFARAAIPKPGQANPFEMEKSGPAATTSAFSKLMSNNVEDTAWATAAAADRASRGKPAYERTCPFYKIMPGFFICVDAFRYGAVEGCKAYFLSHFHSDHYIGLTASWRHGPIYCSKVTGSLVKQQLRTAAKWVVELEFDKSYDIPGTEGASVTMIPANHCPGSSLFLFQKTMSKGPNSRVQRILHCGDFRACPAHVTHPLLKPDILDSVSGKLKQQKIDICYLDTTYLNPRYSFPPQDDVIQASADLCASMSPDPKCKDDLWEKSAKAIGTPAVSKYFHSTKPEEEAGKEAKNGPRQRLLVICGTYSIGKERICIAIAKALKSKIFASPGKIKICKQLGDPELTALLTSDPIEAQVHMQMLMEIRAETLQDYLNSYKPHFSRIVGFRPSGWNFKPSNGKAIGANTAPGSIPTEQVLHGKGWRTRFSYKDFVAQRGSTQEAMCFGVPYSEHSSFRELAMFIMSLRIEKVVPTVNVGSEQSRKRMKAWLDRWMAERRRGGLVRPWIEGVDEDQPDDKYWDGKSGRGGGAWW